VRSIVYARCATCSKINRQLSSYRLDYRYIEDSRKWGAGAEI
jgi:hypothetical protein